MISVYRHTEECQISNIESSCLHNHHRQIRTLTIIRWSIHKLYSWIMVNSEDGVEYLPQLWRNSGEDAWNLKFESSGWFQLSLTSPVHLLQYRWSSSYVHQYNTHIGQYSVINDTGHHVGTSWYHITQWESRMPCPLSLSDLLWTVVPSSALH